MNFIKESIEVFKPYPLSDEDLRFRLQIFDVVLLLWALIIIGFFLYTIALSKVTPLFGTIYAKPTDFYRSMIAVGITYLLRKKVNYRIAAAFFMLSGVYVLHPLIRKNASVDFFFTLGQIFSFRGLALSLVVPALDSVLLFIATFVGYQISIFPLTGEILRTAKGNSFLYALVTGISVFGAALRDQKTRKTEEQKSRIQAMLNSSTYGFLTIDENLMIQPGLSATATLLLGENLLGRSVADILGTKGPELLQLVEIMTQGKGDLLPKDLKTREFKINESIILAEFSPISQDGEVRRVLITLSDVTSRKRLEAGNERLRQTNAAIVKILKNKPLFKEALDSLDALPSVLSQKGFLQIALHTLKGELGFFGFSDWVTLCKEWEALLKKDPPPDNSGYYHRLKTLISTFISQHEDLLQFGELKLKIKDDLPVRVQKLSAIIQETDSIVSQQELSSMVLEALEQPPKAWFSWLNEVWTSTAIKLGKEVSPIEWQNSSEICPELYSQLFRSLIHVARNAIDHGIEPPNERLEKGKSRKGNMIASLKKSDDFYLLTMKDDGRGVNLAKIREIAQTRRIPVVGKSDDEVLNFLFLPDFTSRNAATEISGNGVGLSAVKEEAIRAGGDARLVNDPGNGLEIQIQFKSRSIEDLWMKAS